MTKLSQKDAGSHTKLPNGRFKVRYSLGWDSAKGRYDYLSKTVSSEVEANALIKEIGDYLYHGGKVDGLRSRFSGSRGECFSTYAERWLKRRRQQGTRDGEDERRLSKRTLVDDGTHIGRMSKVIGDTPVDALTPQVLKDAFKELRYPSDGAKPCNGTYLQHIYSTLNLLFEYALARGDLEHGNPLSGVPRPKRDSKEKGSMSVEEAQTVIAKICEAPLTAKSMGILLCLTCGCRPGEMLALRREDVYFDASEPYIYVRHSVEQDTQVIKDTKTGEVRMVPIWASLSPVFGAWMAQQADYLASLGIGQSDETPVVSNKVGGITLEASYRRWLDANRERYQIPVWVTPYSFRHTFITLGGVACGVDVKTIGGLAGHRNTSTTENYLHKLHSQELQAARQMDGLLCVFAKRRICANCSHWTEPPCGGDGICWAGGRDALGFTAKDAECTNTLFEPLMG